MKKSRDLLRMGREREKRMVQKLSNPILGFSRLSLQHSTDQQQKRREANNCKSFPLLFYSLRLLSPLSHLPFHSLSLFQVSYSWSTWSSNNSKPGAATAAPKLRATEEEEEAKDNQKKRRREAKESNNLVVCLSFSLIQIILLFVLYCYPECVCDSHPRPSSSSFTHHQQ